MGWRAISDRCVAASAVALVAALGTGAAAQLGLVDTSGVRWIHHWLFGGVVVTSLLANAPVLRDRGAGAGWALSGAGALYVLTRTRGGTGVHGAAAGAVSLCHVATQVRRR